jgi:hypothetical protein
VEIARGISRGWGVLAGVPALFLAAYLYPLFPKISGFQFCAVRRFLGVDCPGCGLTRSFAVLVRGHIRESVDLHPLGVVIALWLLYSFAVAASSAATGRRPRALLAQRERDILVYAFVAALVVQWAVKLAVA